MKLKAGFTLVEIMIVVAIIAIIAAIAIPSFMRYRKQSQATACSANLQEIHVACEQLLISGKQTSDFSWTLIAPDDGKGPLRTKPFCPVAGKGSDCYTLPTNDTDLPTCSNDTDTDFPHRVPPA